ncbi:putative Intraflagellar transport protein 56 [Blattamonas nauphoetae]|uniref:Intraflagellar transport protein 56 n=1 Tax=Blattamonas nauphoetae TaxID=2049346 RepID=A0ABQ9XDQ6_9EUKA|nr:putative Intraflagellar transport protein 56 [Blattamonas nauphoetae]
MTYARKRVSRPSKRRNTAPEERDSLPVLDDFIDTRNFIGALTFLEHMSHSHQTIATKPNGVDEISKPIKHWMAYCNYHLGKYEEACDLYRELLNSEREPSYYLDIACCEVMMGNIRDAEINARKGPQCTLRERVEFLIAAMQDDGSKMLPVSQRAGGTDQTFEICQNQLCQAAVHFLNGRYTEAVAIYDRLTQQHPDFPAIRIYQAYCNFKLEYYDKALQAVQEYLTVNTRSPTALNLLACINHKLYNERANSLEIIRSIEESSYIPPSTEMVIKHNKVVFKHGEDSLQVLPPLTEEFGEAKQNLIIFYLKNDLIQDAYAMMRDHQPTSNIEYTLKGIVLTLIGQSQAELGGTVSEEHIGTAQKMFEVMGSSPEDCDTVSGRQAMASALFLKGKFGESLKYFESIEQFFISDDAFNMNYGIALASSGRYGSAEGVLERIETEKIKNEDMAYANWMARCYCLNGHAERAWDLYLTRKVFSMDDTENLDVSMEDNSNLYGLLQVIANDCYRTGQFLYAARAFQELIKIEDNEAFVEGKRAACVGIFYEIMIGKRSYSNSQQREELNEAVNILQADRTDHQAQNYAKVMMEWGKKNIGMNFSDDGFDFRGGHPTRREDDYDSNLDDDEMEEESDIESDDQ